MSKRVADKYLTDRDWDQEEEPEEAGVFKQADKTTLERRPIKRAARSIVRGDSPTSGVGSTFKGFAGFTGFKPSSDTKSGFAGFSSNFSFNNGSMSSSELPKTSFTFTSKSSETSVTKESASTAVDIEQLKRPAMHSNHEAVSGKSATKIQSAYLHQLKNLNESVTRWIKQHVDKNPYCLLTPIFKDYEKYLSELEKKYPSDGADAASRDDDKSSYEIGSHERKENTSSPTTASSVFSTDFSSKVAKADGFKFTATSTSVTTSSPPATVGLFTTSSGSDVQSTASSGLFSSAPMTTSMSTFSGFKFSATGSGFSQTGSTSVTPSDTGEGSTPVETGNGDDEEYVPPKLEIKEIKEDDAIYSKRCKLFFKKNDEWKEKGLGHLHLKPCGEKTQLLVRADTTLGNILLNIMLTSTMPLTRQGKNNVALVCVPNPPIDGIKDKEMIPMLIRVKTAEDADELFDKLKEHKS